MKNGKASARRYLWRFGVKSSMWAIRLSAIFSAAAIANGMLTIQPNGWSLAAVIMIYGIWEVSRTVRNRPPALTIMRADALEVKSGASVYLDSADIDRLIKTVAKTAEKREAQLD